MRAASQRQLLVAGCYGRAPPLCSVRKFPISASNQPSTGLLASMSYPLLPSTKSANAALCGKCTVNRSTISDLVIKPISLPRCVKRICRKFYEESHVSLSGRGTMGGKDTHTILCIMFTTSSSGTSVRSSRTETSMRDERSTKSGSEAA